MSDTCFEIVYHFHEEGEGGRDLRFAVRLDKDTLQHERTGSAEPPPWARLGFHQCRHCPLEPEEHAHCPAALSLVDVVAVFNPLFSFASIEVTVETPERTFRKHTSMQRGLSSLIGLYMATSGCPKLEMLKPMARFHLPFATREETIYRAASSYLLAQYFLRQEGKPHDLECDELHQSYMNIQEVNMGIAQRLRGLGEGDANINALVLLDLFAHAIPRALDFKLKSLEYLFKPHLERAAAPAD